MLSSNLLDVGRRLSFYIDGRWQAAPGRPRQTVIDPSTEQPLGEVALGDAQDVEQAVQAARRALPGWAASSREERLALLQRILAVYRRRAPELAVVLSREMGAPLGMALDNQVASGAAHIEVMLDVLADYRFVQRRGTTEVVREAVGVVGMITPWNWPLNQILCKVVPALAAGCSMVLKPSEVAPFNALLLAEVLDEAGVPAGVFNLLNGDGPTVGEALARHPHVAMISITGSTRAGVLVAQAASTSVKRVHQELGGKSANILVDGVDLQHAVAQGVRECFDNSGQSCNAPTRMLVPRQHFEAALAIAREAALSLRMGPADAEGVDLGPVVNQAQFTRIQALIESALEEGVELVCGGAGRPDGLSEGYFVRPTVFACRQGNPRIVREEVFGPVLTLQPYDDLDQAVAMANDTPYGLAAYVQCPDSTLARRLAARLHAGNVYLNYPQWDPYAPFGGFGQSGNGREYGAYGLDDFTEIKGIVGVT
ncbi:aldehyde dehydrogenase family protein [Pseudomonas sp. LRF_L74]|uniref:aldehyde dehydrogenase family protein n=1 Tax=Pseudomonas sp. LRF_L74 TaxID=3369422 RepID=UPI003F6478DE